MRYAVQIEATVPPTEDLLDRITAEVEDLEHRALNAMFTADGNLVTATFEVDTPTIASACVVASDTLFRILVDATTDCLIQSLCVTA